MKSVLIIGLGRFGHHLCIDMANRGNEVMVIDKDEKKTPDLLEYATAVRVGDCTNEEVLRSLGVGNFDLCFVCIGSNFQSSLEITSLVKELGGIPFLTDCNTLYPGSRKNAIEHMYCAWENGFTPLTVGCPVIIGDGLKGTDDIEVPVEGGEYVKNAKIGRAIMDADVFISLNHFKGHETAGFGGAIKNIGMGCGSRAGKMEQHAQGKPEINENLCRGCKRCMRECANEGLVYDETTHKMHIDHNKCLGCGRCIGACNFDAIHSGCDAATKDFNCRMAEYAKAVVDGRPNFHISLVVDVSPNCDCHRENDVPILPNIGMFASFDPLALDQACVDACLKQTPLPNSQLTDAMAKEGFCDHHDHFENTTPNAEYKTCLEHAEKIGIGSRAYELIVMK